MSIRLFQVDSFTDEPFKGNPAGVCLMDDDISDIEKQNLAAEMNCSETAFIYNEGDNYRIRYFTPTQEVQLCGHATLAAAHIVWTEKSDMRKVIVFKTNKERIEVLREGDWIKMGFPVDGFVEGALPIEVKSAIGYSEGVLAIRKTSRGLYLIEVENERMVLDAKPDFNSLSNARAIVIVTSTSSDKQFDFVSRFFAPSVGINEDPVTGIAHMSLGKHWGEKLGKSEMVGYQLSRRKGIVRVQLEKEKTWIAGKAKTVFEIHIKSSAALAEK
jgi:PhzF family phenazine biosynthesis protein